MGAKRIRVGLVGFTGYAGQVFMALAQSHRQIEVVALKSRDVASLKASPDAQDLDVIALATPGEVSHAWVPALLESTSWPILDFSDAYRRDPNFHYGIPELFGAAQRDARAIANPGCYPTSALLMLKPLLDAGLIDASSICVLGTSGATGAGKNPNDVLHFCHLAENSFPYKVGEHRHIAEIEHHLGAPINFVTQILPAQRGILSTAFVRPKASPEAILQHWKEFYSEAPYVTVLETPDRALGIRNVSGSHQGFLAVGPKERSGMLPIFCSIDNLMRGAASQAMHNLNLWFGLPPYEGLPRPLAAHHGAPACYGAAEVWIPGNPAAESQS